MNEEKRGRPGSQRPSGILALGLAVVLAAAGTWHSAAAAQAASGAAVLELARGAARTQSLAAGELDRPSSPWAGPWASRCLPTA